MARFAEEMANMAQSITALNARLDGYSIGDVNWRPIRNDLYVDDDISYLKLTVSKFTRNGKCFGAPIKGGGTGHPHWHLYYLEWYFHWTNHLYQYI